MSCLYLILLPKKWLTRIIIFGQFCSDGNFVIGMMSFFKFLLFNEPLFNSLVINVVYLNVEKKKKKKKQYVHHGKTWV